MSDSMLKLTAYLHQDWDDEFKDLNAALQALKEREPAYIIHELSARIKCLLSQNLSNERLTGIVNSYVDFDYAIILGMDSRRFLEKVVSILEAT